ncbi:MAG: hypothetical protein AAGF19_03180 [Pseudomonadota bacterium]
MLRTLTYLLPALIPSWRFFATIAPSPRIEIATLAAANEPATAWQDLLPLPQRLSLGQTLARLFWSPQRNEALFLTACAERYLADGSVKCLEQIIDHAQRHLARDGAPAPIASYFQIRMRAAHREGKNVTYTELFRSDRLTLANTIADEH